MQKKKLTYITGFYEGMTKPQPMVIGEKLTTKKRSLVTFVTEDEQKAFFEIREAIIDKITKLGLQKGDQITVGFVFIGLKKNDKTYNNLFINEIDYVR